MSLEETATMQIVSENIHEAWGVPPDLQKLSFNGKAMKVNMATATLKELPLKSGDSL